MPRARRAPELGRQTGLEITNATGRIVLIDRMDCNAHGVGRAQWLAFEQHRDFVAGTPAKKFLGLGSRRAPDLSDVFSHRLALPPQLG